MARRKISENVLVNWLNQFRRPAPETSPELPRRAPFPPAAPPPVETTSAPAPPPPPEPPPGQRPRRLLIRGSEIFEVAEDGDRKSTRLNSSH
jgi:hypothetical protein